MDNKYRVLLYIMELAATVTGFLCWKKLKNTYWKWFPVYLAVIVLAETTAEYAFTGLNNVQLNTAINAYFSIPLQFLFLCWLFYQYFKGSEAAWAAVAGAILYVIVMLMDYLWLAQLGKKFIFLSFSYTAGNIILLVLIILFFIRFAISNQILHYRESRMFKVCIGLLIFYMGSLPFYGLYYNLWSYYRDLAYVYYDVQFVMGAIMYAFFAISFIWSKRN